MRTPMWLGLVVGCGSDSMSPPDPPPDRERDVIVLVEDVGTLIYRDEDGPWQLAPELAPGRYGFDLEGERYGIAFTCVDPASQVLDARHSTLAEQVDHVFRQRCDLAVDGFVDISGTLRGLAMFGYRVSTQAGVLEERSSSAAETPYLVATLPSGAPQSVVYASLDEAGRADRFVIQRDLIIADDRIADVDFAFEGTPAATQEVTHPDQDVTFVLAQFITADGIPLDLGLENASPATLSFPPAAVWRAGDQLVLRSSAQEAGQFQDALIRVMDVNAIPGRIPRPIGLASGSVTLGPDGIVGAWAEYPATESFGIALSGFDTVPNPACRMEFCIPEWKSSVSPSRRTEGNVVFPTVAELQALGAWDDRLLLGTGLNWTAFATGTSDGVAFSVGHVGTLEGTTP